MCTHPITLSDGRRVPCGRCYDCRKSRANKFLLQARSELESVGVVGCMLTLTYSDEKCHYVSYTPVSVSLESQGLSCALDFAREQFPAHVAQRIKQKRETSTCYDYLFLSKYPVLVPCFDDGTDITRFLKRIRIKLLRNSEKFGLTKEQCKGALKYLYSGEYGTFTFRPHYHIILMSPVLSPEMFMSFIRTIVIPDWECNFGHVDNSGIIRSGSKATYYVSKYIYKPSSHINPYLLYNVVSKPPVAHSQLLGRDIRKKFSVLVPELLDSISAEIDSEGAYKTTSYFGKYLSFSDFSERVALYRESDLCKRLDALYDLAHPVSVSHGKSYVTDLTFFLRPLFKKRPVTYVYFSHVDNPEKEYSYTLQGHDFESDLNSVCSLSSDYKITRVVRTWILDCSDPVYSAYQTHRAVRYFERHSDEIRELSESMPFATYLDVLCEFRVQFDRRIIAQSLSNQSKHSRFLVNSSI